VIRRREFIAGLGSAAAWPTVARAQQVRRVGMLLPYAESDPENGALVTTFREELQKLGWTPGGNLQIEPRWAGADPERIRVYAAELVALKPDVIFATTSLTLAPLQQLTRTIPIVFTQINDPVGSGFVNSLARPGGNITGFAPGEFSMYGKYPELLKEIAPSIARVAVLLNPEQSPNVGMWRVIEAVAPSMKIEATAARVHNAADINRAIESFAGTPNGGLIVLASPITNSSRGQIVTLAARYRLRAIYPFRYHVAEGGLMSYGPDVADLFRSCASYVDRILRGAKVAELPVQLPTKFEMVVNLKTAKALGLAVPPSILLRAEVIE
jgi:putative tryptophan/tyrosine transport system substrate-binding protein